MATGRYTAHKILQIVSHITEKSFAKMADEEKNQENVENDMPLMNDAPVRCFAIGCDEDETDCTKGCGCELEKKLWACGHLMSTFCIE